MLICFFYVLCSGHKNAPFHFSLKKGMDEDWREARPTTAHIRQQPVSPRPVNVERKHPLPCLTDVILDVVVLLLQSSKDVKDSLYSTFTLQKYDLVRIIQNKFKFILEKEGKKQLFGMHTDSIQYSLFGLGQLRRICTFYSIIYSIILVPHQSEQA